MAIKGHKTDNITTANSGLAQFFACYRINTYLDIAKNSARPQNVMFNAPSDNSKDNVTLDNNLFGF